MDGGRAGPQEADADCRSAADVQGAVQGCKHGPDDKLVLDASADHGGAPAASDAHETHGPRVKPLSIVNAVASAVVNFLLMFGLCCAYGMIMFNDDWNRRHRALGVKMNLVTAMIFGLLLAWKSKIGVAIGGPDLNPVVFLGGFVQSIAEDIARQQFLVIPAGDHRRLADDRLWTPLARCLGASSASSDEEFCEGAHFQANEGSCVEYHEQLRATTIFAVTVSSAVLGLLFFCLGRLRGTRYVAMVPTSVMEAFLSCVGYKVMKYALKFCKYDPRQFLPAACIGVPLYFIKAMHLGNPAVVIPLFLLLPLVVYYAWIFGSGSDLEAARDLKHMFPHMENVDFWRLWADGVGKADKINLRAWVTTLPDFAVMIVVVTLDCLLKISSTEGKLGVAVHKDHEIQLHGVGNVATVACCSTVGYMQLKFNVINYGILGNLKDRRAGAIYALLCGVCFFTSIELFNYLPRFFLGILLFFAGAGFVAENLWGSRKYLCFREWLQILVILGVFIITGGLHFAVLVGGCLTGLDFISRYSKVKSIVGKPMKGSELTTRDRHAPLLASHIRHVVGAWLLVIRLKGFIFFASAQALTTYVRSELERQDGVPAYRRLRYVVFDCKMLDGMDASASKAMKILTEDADERGFRILWCHVSPERCDELERRTIVQSRADCFDNLEGLLKDIHGQALKYCCAIRERWLQVHPAFSRSALSADGRAAFDPFQHALVTDLQRSGCPWRYCHRLHFVAGQHVLSKGRRDASLILIHSGAVGLFEDGEHNSAVHPDQLASGVYRRGWFLNREVLIGMPTQLDAVAVEDGEALCWDEQQFFQMKLEHPAMAAAICKIVTEQQVRDWELVRLGLLTEQVGHTDFARGDGGDEAVQFASGRDGDKAPKAFLRVSGGSINSGTSSVEIEEQGDLPGTEDFEPRLRGLRAAARLGALGLDPSVAASARQLRVLPPLPAHLRKGVEVAFRTYARRARTDPAPTIAPGEVDCALMYAGIFDRVPSMPNAEGGKGLSEDAFLALAHRSAMATLCAAQVRTIKSLFRRFDTEEPGLSIDQLSVLFREVVHPRITVEEVEGLACKASRVHLDEFLAMVSRYMRLLQNDCDMAQGFRELVGGDGVAAGDEALTADQLELTADQLARNSKVPLGIAQAEELLWAAKLPRRDASRRMASRAPTSVHLSDVASIVFLQSGVAKVSNLPSVGEDIPCGVESVGEASPRSPWLLVGGSDLANDRAGQVAELHELLAAVEDSLRMVDAPAADDCLIDLQPSQLVASDTMVAMSDSFDNSMLVERVKSNCDVPVRRAGTAGRRALQEGGKRLRARVYLLTEVPSSSQSAEVLSTIMAVHIVISVLILFLEPLVASAGEGSVNSVKNVWLVMDWYFSIVFSIELVVRLAVADATGDQTLKGFLRNPSNVCDFVAVFPFYIELFGSATSDTQNASGLLKIARLLKLSRIMRVARLSKRKGGGAFWKMATPVAVVFTIVWGIYLNEFEVG